MEKKKISNEECSEIEVIFMRQQITCSTIQRGEYEKKIIIG